VDVQLHAAVNLAVHRQVVTFTPWLLYLLGKSPEYHLDKPQSWSGSFREKKYPLLLPGNNSNFSHLSSPQLSYYKKPATPFTCHEKIESINLKA